MALFLILIGVLARIATHFHDQAPFSAIFHYLPHIPNFAPIAAIALFGGTYLNKKYALTIPIIAMLIADYFIGFYNPYIMMSVYGSFIIIGLIGIWLRNNKNLSNIVGASLSGSIIFFLATNFAVWVVPYSAYPHTIQGLIDSYVMGLPFFRNTIAGDIFYVTIFFGTYEIVLALINKVSKRSQVVEI